MKQLKYSIQGTFFKRNFNLLFKEQHTISRFSFSILPLSLTSKDDFQFFGLLKLNFSFEQSDSGLKTL